MLFQATQLGLGSRWEEVKKAYAMANQFCGDIIKVTPSSKMVGDLAQFMVNNHLDYNDLVQNSASIDFPMSVQEYFQGEPLSVGAAIPDDGS